MSPSQLAAAVAGAIVKVRATLAVALPAALGTDRVRMAATRSACGAETHRAPAETHCTDPAPSQDPAMTLNWEGGFQYGGACTADGLADAAAAFPALPGARRWLATLDRSLDTYLKPPSPPQMLPCGTHYPYGAANASQSCAYALLHNATLPPTDLAALEATVGDHLGLFPIAYLSRARRRGPAHPGAAADLKVARVTAERYILGFPHRVPPGLPAAGAFARTGGDPRENSTGAATFLCDFTSKQRRSLSLLDSWSFG